MAVNRRKFETRSNARSVTGRRRQRDLGMISSPPWGSCSVPSSLPAVTSRSPLIAGEAGPWRSATGQLLAWRSSPWFSRWRTIFPDEASTGLTPGPLRSPPQRLFQVEVARCCL